MSALDTLADKAEASSGRFAGEPGIKGKFANELAEDATFLRKLKPSLIAKRAKAAPRARRSRGGPSPLLVVGAALGTGVALAKWIDWRGHAHPRG